MNILLLCPEKDDGNMIAMSLDAWFAAKTTIADSFKSATPHLLDKGAVDLLIGVDHAETQSLLKYLVSIHFPIPLVLLARGKPSRDWTGTDLGLLGTVDITSSLDDLHDLLRHALEEGLIAMHLPDSDFVEIRTELLAHVVPLKCDIHVRLAKNKFVKLFRQGQTFTKDDLERFLVKKRVEHLHFRQQDAAEIVPRCREKLKAAAAKSPERAAESALAVAQQIIRTVGFTPDVQELVRENMQVVLKSVGKTPKLAYILKSIAINKDQYIASHSVSLAKVACGLAAKMNWPSESTFQKLILASLCHDITLPSQKLAAIRDLSELDKRQSEFTADEVDRYKEHPFNTAELLRSMNEVPADVHTIILQHHERPDGTGFPRALGPAYIAPLAAVFIVAHDLIDFMHEKEKAFDLAFFIKYYREKFPVGNFKRIVAGLG